jgi:hypothetical protein
MSKLMSTAQVFCETRVHFGNQLAKEKAARQKAKEDGDTSVPKVSDEVMSYLNKIETSWERRLSVSLDPCLSLLAAPI